LASGRCSSARRTPELFRWPQLIAVTDLSSASGAVEEIIDQGEDARGDWRSAHYGRFLGVWEEYQELRRRDASFEPARPVVPAFTRASRSILVRCPGDRYGRTMPDLVDISPSRFAPLIAPVIERLTLAVVNSAMARAARTPVPAGGSPGPMRMFGQLRTALLARDVTATGLAAIYRYRDADDVRRDLEGLHAAGLISNADDGAIRATETGRTVLTEMYKVTAEVVGELWAGQEGSLTDLNHLAGRLVHAALATGGDAYSTMAPPHEPAEATAGLLLHTRLSVLRYHRADAHAAAWQAAGLTSTTVGQMPAGPARDAIEEDTNRRAGVPYATLDMDERITLLAGLAALPG
jgi:hypothetical protein